MSEWAGIPAAVGSLFAAAWQSWSKASLVEVAAQGGGYGVPAPELLGALASERSAVAAWLGAALGGAQGPEALLATELVRWLRQKNQFFELDAAAEARLVADLRAELERAAALLASPRSEPELHAELASLFEAFRARSASLVRECLGEAPREIVQSEYSPELVLEVLGMPIEGLRDPILDVGCGKGALLVRLLRAQGHVAHGIDRDAPADIGSAVDWLSFDYGKERWGTVLSHLGFSLYFWHHHLRGGEAPLRYAHSYMSILRALQIGGTFAYAPALPFIEALLPPQTYRTKSGPLPEPLRVDALLSAERTTGIALGTRTRIERIAR